MPKREYPKIPDKFKEKLVACADCGFLAVRHFESHELVEPDKSYRLCGIIPEIFKQERTFKIWEMHPICFSGAANLGAEEIFANKDGLSWEDSVMDVVNKFRKCESFTEWKLGFTPKEHKEMIDRQWQQKFEEDRRKSDRKWRIIELLAFVATGAAVAFIAAWIERGSLW